MIRTLLALFVCIVAVAVSSAAFCDEPSSPPLSSSTEASAAVKPSEPGKPYTAVIIDASGLDLQRSMSPKLRRPDGTEVWGTIKNVDYSFIGDHGLVSYVASVEEGKKNWRCGQNPVVIKAVALFGGNMKCDPVITTDDAKLLMDENAKAKFMDGYHVIFVKGPALLTTAKVE